jgi:hypothetical protein
MASRVIAMPLTLEGLDPALRTALLGFTEVTLNSVDRIPDVIGDLYENNNYSPKRITYPVYSGLADAGTWDGVTPITPSEMSYLYDVEAEQFVWANGIAYTFMSELFDEYGLNKKLSGEQGIAGESARQKAGFSLLNNGFVTNWYDGVPFFSASHPMSPIIGGVQSNLQAGALSHDTLQDAVDKGCSMTDVLGRPLDAVPVELWVHTTQGAYGDYLVNKGNGLASGTPNNDNNPFGRLTVKPTTYMGTSTMWAVRFRTRRGKKLFKSRKMYKLYAPKENNAHGYQRDLVWCESYWAEEYYEFVGSTGV